MKTEGANVLGTPVVRSLWPGQAEWDVTEACERLGLRDRVRDLSSSFAAMSALDRAPAPIVGVMGLLNAGKSSLVSSFLSEAGASRVPKGISDEEGTQRFVFWLPDRWRREPEVLAAVRDELTALFGGKWQELSDDIGTAHRQYNGDGATADLFPVPLVAFDPKLDELGFGLLDCPDFERPHPGVDGKDTARIRRQFVATAARLMSAALVIAEARKLGAESSRFCADPETGLDRKARFLLVNLVSPSDGVNWLLGQKSTQELMRLLGIKTIYAAYNHDAAGAAQVIPKVAQDMGARGVPVFFEVGAGAAENRPDVITDDRLLPHRLRQLQPAEIWREKRRAFGKRVEESIFELEAHIEAVLKTQTDQINKARDGLIGFIRERVTRDGRLAFPVPPDAAEQLAYAIIDSAPWWAKPVMWFSHAFKILKKFGEVASDWYGRLKDPSGIATEPISRVYDGMKKRAERDNRGFFLDAKRWADGALRCKFMPDSVDKKTLETTWAEVFNHAFGAKVNLDKAALRAFGEELWDQVPAIRKVILAGTAPFLLVSALAALVVGAVDGGVTAVLFTWSIKELLVALGLGAMIPFAGAGGGAFLEKNLMQMAAIPFYSRLLKGALDIFALPRGLDGPLRENFSNTGTLKIDLGIAPDERRLSPRIETCANAFLGESISGGWEAMRREAREWATREYIK